MKYRGGKRPVMIGAEPARATAGLSGEIGNLVEKIQHG
jgi:hypothetical protein